ncbi:MFS transporter [Streptomyces sp. NBC_00249]|uniref:MFS transporter n=1 Tax=Streptomyces sp. NBC_00249 TaxID=2975690 RepID=UPI002251C242|nr:MFS transporter [Streptomyces sp. NBC_00249]MCX5199498.1 MFS transporter [Streptomyces sp. NBC_00249]
MSSPSTAPSRRRAVTATVVGNFVESFDWLAYALFAPLFAPAFFPSTDPLTSLLGAFAVLGIGVLARPVGGVLLARFADRRGRRPALMLAIGLMTGGSLLIALTPGHSSIGLAAPLLLLLARIAQGISAGGEWPTAAAYLMEQAPRGRACLYGSLFSLTTASGVLLASLLGAGLTGGLGPEAMASWGWRVPFLVGAALGLVLMVMRTRMTETEVFRREVRSRPTRGSLRRVLTAHRRQVLVSVLFVAGTATVGGTWTALVPAMGARLVPPGTMFWVVVCGTALVIAANVPVGLLADKVGPRRFLAAASLLFAAVGSYGYLTMSGNFASLLLAYGSGALFLVCATTTLPAILSGIFPPEVRVLGIGLPHALTTAVLGGVGPALATYLDGRDASGWFIAGAMTAVLLSLPAAALSAAAPDGSGAAPDQASAPLAHATGA